MQKKLRSKEMKRLLTVMWPARHRLAIDLGGMAALLPHHADDVFPPGMEKVGVTHRRN